MPKVCAYPRCFNQQKRNSTVIFHKMPTGDPALLQLWLSAMNMNPVESPTESLLSRDPRVCGEHFSPDDYRTIPKKGHRISKLLKKYAVPATFVVPDSELNYRAVLEEEPWAAVVVKEEEEESQIAVTVMDEEEEESDVAVPAMEEEESNVAVPGMEKEESNVAVPVMDASQAAVTVAIEREESVWEPEDNLQCPDLMAEYMMQKEREEKKRNAGSEMSADRGEEIGSKRIKYEVVLSEDSWDEEEDLTVPEDSSDSDFVPQGQHSDFTESDSGTDEIDEEDGETKRQLCPQCGKLLYKNHKKTHTCDDYTLKPYPCHLCGKCFVSEAHLKIHSRIHREGYEHRCTFCLKTFKVRGDKIAHEKRHPPVEKPYQCPDCPEVFAKRKDRHDHRRSHRGPYCPICNMEFPNRFKLDRHMVVHTGTKQFACEVCQRSFSQASHLKSHMRVHTGEKPYQCQHCDQSFNHNVRLKSHIQRYHGQVLPSDTGKKTERNGSEAELDVTNELENNAAEAEQSTKDTECNPEEEEEEMGEELNKRAKKGSQNATGRPRGRPKRNVMFISD